MDYSDLQERAIDAIVAWYGQAISGGPKEFLLNGYAGTGKSTVVAEAISRIKNLYNVSNVATGAYTGKAAYVLRKKGNPTAQTIHSMIYTVKEDEYTGEITSILNPLGTAAMAELLVLDEHSMISKEIAEDLRSFGKPLLIMGDPAQLPPISGVGAFEREPDFFLNEIHRQAADSPIIELATMARRGERLPMGYKKGAVQVLPLNRANGELVHNPETQVLCGLNRVRWALTQAMRKNLGFSGTFPVPGEKIVCKRNNKERGLFNGGAGVLQKLEIRDEDMSWHNVADGLAGLNIADNAPWRITGEIEGAYQHKLVTDPYLFKQHFDNGKSQRDWKKKGRNDFDWSYVWSIHTAQGSGWTDVTLIDNSSSFRENEHKHRYTGITRAESTLTILV